MDKYLFLIVVITGHAKSYIVRDRFNQAGPAYDSSFELSHPTYRYNVDYQPYYEPQRYGNHEANYRNYPRYNRRHYGQEDTSFRQQWPQSYGERQDLNRFRLFPVHTFTHPWQKPQPKPTSILPPPAPVNSAAVLQECTRSCPVTSEYNPVCGTNNMTYSNPGKLSCAQYCGVNVKLKRTSPCAQAMRATTESFLTSQQPLSIANTEIYFNVDERK